MTKSENPLFKHFYDEESNTLINYLAFNLYLNENICKTVQTLDKRNQEIKQYRLQAITKLKIVVQKLKGAYI